ncbi:MAG: hypothetical protein LBD46_02285 [Endomicrobium sp.]|jgi:hypothetical protein|nr:hypothetical protein [Endomicrobium sp.]
MEKQEIIKDMEKFINRIDVLKAESGPKASDFIKWVREVKQFIEKTYGADHDQLRAFKKIDYYPKQFDILSSEASFKKAWIEGLMIAKDILENLKADAEGISRTQKEKSDERNGRPQENAESSTSTTQTLPSAIKEEKKEEKSSDKKGVLAKGKKVLLINIEDRKLKEYIFTFIKKMGYEPLTVDPNAERDVFITDTLAFSIKEEPAFAIINWKGDLDYNGKKIPKPCITFSTGFYVAKLTSRKVLIISRDDIEFYDENYGGLNFLEIDDIKELMELKLAREMDAAGLNIDFNFLKKE